MFGATNRRLNIWDVSGAPEFFDVRSEFYKETHGIVLMFDVTSRKSYESLDAWLKEATKCLPGIAFFVTVVGNKTDKPGRMVSERQASDWAKKFGHRLKQMKILILILVLLNTSAKTIIVFPKMIRFDVATERTFRIITFQSK